MKLPSLRQMAGSALSTLKRFPFALLDAAIGTLAAVIVAGWSGDKDTTWEILNNIFVTSSLGIALYVTMVLVGERRKWGAVGLVALLCGTRHHTACALPRDGCAHLCIARQHT